MKKCRKCGVEKPLEDFYDYSGKQTGKRSRCKSCHDGPNKITTSKWKELHKEQVTTYNKLYIKEYNLKYKYGITSKIFNELLLKQNNRCGICNTEFTDKNKPCVDHNHLTDEVRGLLCRTHNAAIGLLDDDVNLLKKAIEYLVKGNHVN
jgi:Recombination endonuclease VII